MSYVFDVHRGKGEACKNPLDVALYISFFPQLIAGPIVRYETIAEQIQNRNETFFGFCDGVQRFMVGFIKKVLIANNVALAADAAFALESPSAAVAWLGVLAYTLQIYYDFSGYSDMAIGLGKMFGFTFNENFNYPYISSSVSEFWRRWHISLGSWFRDYVYFPLGGSRVNSKTRLAFNLFVVWFLTGVWHGANTTFFLWGILYFILIAAEKFTDFPSKLKFFGHIYTLFFVMIGWVLFRSDSLSSAVNYIGCMFGFNGEAPSTNLSVFKNCAFFIISGIVFSTPVMKKIPPVLQQIGIIVFYTISLTYIFTASYNPFIYFNF